MEICAHLPKSGLPDQFPKLEIDFLVFFVLARYMYKYMSVFICFYECLYKYIYND